MKFRVLVLIFILMLTGCRHSISGTAVDLNEQIIVMVQEGKRSHLALLDDWADQRKQRASEFIENKWTPLFMTKARDNVGLQDRLDNASTPESKAKIIDSFSSLTAKKIAERRLRIYAALDRIEQSIRTKIEDHYERTFNANAALNRQLRVAAKITETERQILRKLRLGNKNLIPLDAINAKVETVIRYEGELEKLTNDVTKIIENVRRIGNE